MRAISTAFLGNVMYPGWYCTISLIDEPQARDIAVVTIISQERPAATLQYHGPDGIDPGLLARIRTYAAGKIAEARACVKNPTPCKIRPIERKPVEKSKRGGQDRATDLFNQDLEERL